jgi:hypothetical protein
LHLLQIRSIAGESRTIALDSETVEALRQHREAQLLERAFAGEAYVDQDVVFADELGRPIYPQRLTEAFLRQRKAVPIAERFAARPASHACHARANEWRHRQWHRGHVLSVSLAPR